VRDFTDRELYESFRRLKAKASLTYLNDLVLALAKADRKSLLPVRSELERMVSAMKGASTNKPLDIAALKVTEAVLNMVYVKTGRRKITVTVEVVEDEQ
jgi:hypothetical protein